MTIRGRFAGFVVLLSASGAFADAHVTAQVGGNQPPMVSASDPIATGIGLESSVSNVYLGQGSSCAAAADVTTGTLRVFSRGTVLMGPAVEAARPAAARRRVERAAAAVPVALGSRPQPSPRSRCCGAHALELNRRRDALA
jgi:hypothetical protein